MAGNLGAKPQSTTSYLFWITLIILTLTWHVFCQKHMSKAYVTRVNLTFAQKLLLKKLSQIWVLFGSYSLPKQRFLHIISIVLSNYSFCSFIWILYQLNWVKNLFSHLAVSLIRKCWCFLSITARRFQKQFKSVDWNACKKYLLIGLKFGLKRRSANYAKNC